MTSCETLEDFKRFINVAIQYEEWVNDWTAVEVVIGYELLPVTILGDGWVAMRDDVRTVRTEYSLLVIATYLVKRKV